MNKINQKTKEFENYLNDMSKKELIKFTIGILVGANNKKNNE